MFILADRQNALRDRQVLSGDYGNHARQRECFRGIAGLDQGMWEMRAKNFAEEHARQDDIVGIPRLAGTLRARVNLARRFAYDVERFRDFGIVNGH